MRTGTGRGWPSRVAAVAATLLALAGCGGDPDRPSGGSEGAPEPADPTPTAAMPDVEVEHEIGVVDGRVRAQYTVTNRTEERVFLPNRVPVPSGGGTRYANLPYLTGAEDGVVVLSQRAFPWPGGDVALADEPRGAGTMLPPGETVTVALAADVPLERRHPFGDDLGEGAITLPDPVTGLQLCVGVFVPPFPPAMELAEVDDPDYRDVFTFAHGNAAHAAQYLFCSEVVAYEE